ncbi:MAG TPA: hypothetical protein VGH28_01780 [Polyangiaceae bacterium]|jgi:hypothetical protein
MRRWQVGLAVVAFAVTARAQERVTLADGTVMQGELVEKVPGDHITIKLATGEIRTIQWSALAPQPPAVTVQAAPPPVPVTQAPPAGPSTHVMIDADEPGVTLLRVTGLGMVQATSSYGTTFGAFMSYAPICVAPCEANLETSGMYRVAGDGVTPTGTFSLPPPSANGAMRLHVHAGSLGARVGGLWLTVGGITIALAGGVLAGTAAALQSSQADLSGLLIGGLVTAGIGVVMTAIGIPLIAQSGTSVFTDDGFRLARVRAIPGGFAF